MGDASRYHHSASVGISLRHFLAARKYRNHHGELWWCQGPRTNSSKNIEVILVAPPVYIAHNNPKVQDGFGDWSFLVKYRLAAANEEHGNYILTAFLQVTFPTGQYKNGSTNTTVTPTIAHGKGIGSYGVQGTFGVTLPAGNEAQIGRTLPWNNAFQVHLYKKLWPEVEINYT